jgi:putative colanic acid biosynthesis acetyltransferase WcaF
MDLSIFDNSDFDRGAPRWKEALWTLARFVFFQNAFPWSSSLRCALLRAFGAKIGRAVVIRANANISFPWRLTIGDHVWIGEDVGILTLASVTIESNVCISQRTYLCTGSHDFRREDFRLRVAPITVREGSWIAASCFIAPGVEIGPDAIVSAGSVVFESVAPKTFVRGNPAAVVSEMRKNKSELGGQRSEVRDL